MDKVLQQKFSKEVEIVFRTDRVEMRMCQDDCVGCFNDWQGQFLDNCKPSLDYSRVFMILESPHVDELANDPILPTRGKTGTRIRDYWQAIFGQLF